MFIVLLGIQGSGKGTQAELLSKKIGIPHISTGDILREIAKENTPEGRRIDEMLKSGVYLSDDEMTHILRSRLPRECILDGYPRTLHQAHLLDKITHVDHALFINLHEQEALRRLLARGRSDDTPGAIHLRFQEYHAEADGIVDHYAKQHKLLEVNGDQSIERVFADVCRAIRL
jgi:adenylate kinase